MTKSQLIRYQRELWPAACAGQRWDARDDVRRRDTRQYCLEAIGVEPITKSIHDFNHDEVTALFTLLAHLADPDNITLAQRWEDCKANYKAFNRSRQADHWQRKAYGTGGGQRLTRNRFYGRRQAEAPAFAADALTLEAAEQRLMTMRSRAKRKHRGAHASSVSREASAPRQQLTSAQALINAGFGAPESDEMPF